MKNILYAIALFILVQFKESILIISPKFNHKSNLTVISLPLEKRITNNEY